MYGVEQFTPLINPPQAAILAFGRRQADELMTLRLLFDHRAVNGADAAKFLGAIFDAL
jgi:pyruvate dehydrogenase E2 component (dihydrolipoamide acetyltransferase)